MKRSAVAKRIRLPVLGLRELDTAYATIPSSNCKGLCQECCGPVGMTRLEWDRIIARVGKTPSPTPEQAKRLECPLLADGKCTVYDIRPLVCRLWGVEPSMPCPFGCEPDRPFTTEDGIQVMKTVSQIDQNRYPT